MVTFIIKYWIECIFGAAITGLTFCYKALKKKSKEQDALREGVLAILHDRLFWLGTDYIASGEISVSEMENFEGMYKAYHALGGNGTGTAIYDKVKALHIRKED